MTRSANHGRNRASKGVRKQNPQGGNVSVRKWMAGAAVALVAVLGLAVVGGGSAAPAKQQATPLKVAVVTDIGGLNDKGFNALAYNGLKVAQRQYGVQGRVFISKSAADYVPNLSTGAKSGYDLVIAESASSWATRWPRSRRSTRRRSSRSSTSMRPPSEGQAEERPRHHLRRAGGRLPRRRRSCDRLEDRARSRRSAVSRSRRSTRSSPATSTAPRR